MRPTSARQSRGQDDLIDFLLKVPAFQDKHSRDGLLFGLDNLGAAIPRSNVAVTDVIAIVRSLEAVGQIETGKWPLVILMRNAQRYCPPDTQLGQQLAVFLAEYESSSSR